MSSKKLVKASIAAGVSVVALGTAIWFFWYVRQSIVPAEIFKQLSFSPLVYVGGGGYKATSYKYASEEKVFSYVIEGKDGNTITVTEQSQPEQFTEIPEYKDRFLDNVVKRYASVQSSEGVVYLTKPPKQGRQVGVIIDKGLLIFMSAKKDLNEDQWRKITDHLELERI